MKTARHQTPRKLRMSRAQRVRHLLWGTRLRKVVVAGLALTLSLAGFMLTLSPARALVQGDGLLFYGASANTNPQVRTYNANDNFVAAANTVVGATPQVSAIKTSPTKTEAISGYVSSTGTLQIMCFNGTTWTNEWTAAVGGTGTTRLFDIAYEQTSGNVMVVYGDGANMSYRTKSNSLGCGSANWAAASSFTPTRTTGTISWIKLAANTTNSSNLLTVAWSDANSDLSARVWSGSAWGNEHAAALSTTLEFATAAQDVDNFDVAYESVSGDLMVVWGNTGTDTTGLIGYAVCTGNSSSCTWTAGTTVPTVADAATHIDLAADPTSDKMSLAALDNGSDDLSAAYWSGTAWTGYANLDTATEDAGANMKIVQTGWLTSGSASRWVVSFNDAATSYVAWYAATPGSAPALQSAFTSGAAPAGVKHWFEIAQNPHDDAELMLVYTDADVTDNLYALRMVINGSGTISVSVEAGGGMLGSVDKTASGDFSFAYWNYIPPADFDQSGYRLFANADSTDVGAALADQNVPVQLGSTGALFRLRMLLHMTNTVASSGQTFKLQFVDKGTGTCASPGGGTPGSYTDITTSTAIAYRNNTTPADGATLTGNTDDPTHGAHTVVNQTYEEANNFTNSVAAINAGQDGKWDFALFDNGAPAGTSYCLRVVKSDGTTTGMGYTERPELTTYMPQSTIDSAMFNVNHAKQSNTSDTIFISDQIGYIFYRNITTAACAYAKTTNGGATWTADQTLGTTSTCLKIVVWYDQWTPGDTTGTKIHLLYLDSAAASGAEEIFYIEFDTVGDTKTTPLLVNSGEAATVFAVSTRPSIIKSTGGTLYFGLANAANANKGFVKKCSVSCATVGTNWSNITPTGYVNNQDETVLMPLPGDDLLFVLQDVTAGTLGSKVYDAGTGTWDAAFTSIDTGLVENATYRGAIGATVDRVTNDIYIAYPFDNGTLGTDDDIKTEVYSGGTWTAKGNIITNDARGITYVKLGFNENTAELYAVYSALTTPATITTGNIYYKKSSDGMTTWGSESAQLNTASGDINGSSIGLMSNERLYVTWQDIQGSVGVLYGANASNLVQPTYRQSDFRAFNNADSANVGTALAAQNTPGTVTFGGGTVRIRSLVKVAGDGARAGLHSFKLQYAGKGGGSCTSPSGAPAVYTDVTTTSDLAYYNNATPADGAALTANANDPTPSSGSKVNQTYEEANNFTSTSLILGGNYGLWDFSLNDLNAMANTTYCLKIVKSDGTGLAGYSNYMEVITAQPTTGEMMRHGSWFSNESERPLSL
jgi:hypothetical protein